MVVLKKIFGHVITFTLGTLVSGSVATAAVTNLVQAHKQNATIVVSGKSSGTTELIYNGRAYLPIGDIQGILQKAGATSTWTAGKLVVSIPSTTDNGTGVEVVANRSEILAITQSVLNVANALSKVESDLQTEAQNNDKTGMQTSLQTALTALNTESQSMNQVKAGDAAGQKILSDYISVLSSYENAFQELSDSIKNNDSTLAKKAEADANSADAAFTSFEKEWETFLKS